jgi:hypothetical protein
MLAELSGDRPIYSVAIAQRTNCPAEIVQPSVKNKKIAANFRIRGSIYHPCQLIKHPLLPTLSVNTARYERRMTFKRDIPEPDNRAGDRGRRFEGHPPRQLGHSWNSSLLVQPANETLRR